MKTLEEIDINQGTYSVADEKTKEPIRQEIIKLIKENRRDCYCTICGEFNCSCSSSDCFKVYHWDDVFTLLKYFFNITVEELTQKTGEEAKHGA